MLTHTQNPNDKINLLYQMQTDDILTPISFDEIYHTIVECNGDLQTVVASLKQKYGEKSVSYHGLRAALLNPRTRGIKTNTNSIHKYIGVLSDEEYRYIDQLIKDHQYKARFTKKKLYSLAGLCKCAECGTNYTILSNNQGVVYYRCGNRTKDITGKYNCHNRKYIKYYDLEMLIYEQMTEHYIHILNDMKRYDPEITEELEDLLQVGLRDTAFWLSLDDDMKWEINHYLIDEILLHKDTLVDIRFKRY